MECTPESSFCSNGGVRSLLIVAGLVLGLLSPARAQTLDAELARIMHGRTGTAVVLDVHTGMVLGAYHPEVAARVLARPGSAIKPFTLLALLSNGKVQPSEKLVCRHTVRIAGRNLNCSHPETGQPLDAVSALAYSCNDFFTMMAKRLRSNELRTAFVQSGFTARTQALANDVAGSVALASSPEQRQLQAIGEEGIEITPLEMVAAYRSLALHRASPTAAESTVFAGLEASTTYGMARLAQPPGLKVAGKTGTARADEGAWTHGWFAGFAPAEKPEIAVVVFLERGTGPGDAAPAAAEIFRAWQKARVRR